MSAGNHRVGRFTSREHAESCRPEWEKSLGVSTIVVEREGHVGEFELMRTDVKQQIQVQAPVADQRSKFDVISAEDFLKRPRPEWIIKGVLPRAELAMVYAPKGSGKSFFALDMAAAITRGIDWHGWRTRKGRVVFLLAEGAAGFRNRIEAYAKDRGVSSPDLPEFIDDVPNLKTAEDAELIARKIGKADVLFIDTFAASFIGNESSGEDVGPVLAHAKYLHRMTGAVVCFLCHPGKDQSKGIRGWSGIEAAMDTGIEIVRTGEHRAVTLTKQKDGVEGPLMFFTLRPVELGRDEEGDAITSAVVEPCDKPARGIVRTATFAGVNQKAIEKALLKLASAGNTASVLDVRAEALNYVAGEDTKSKRANIKKALDDLVAKELVFLHGVNDVSLTSAVRVVETPEHDWLCTDIGAEAVLRAANRGNV